MLKYDEYIHCFTFLDYFTQSFYLTLYHFIEVIFLSSFVMPDPFFVHLPLHERKKIGESLYSFQT